MTASTCTPFAVVAGLAAILALQACTTPPSVPPAVPTFHEVARTGPGVRTGQRIDEEGTEWQFYTHDELEASWCADLAVAPDGRMRYLAFLHPAPDDRWMLSIRTGLGPSTWSSTFSGVEVPPVIGTDGFPSVSCHPVRIAHLRDDLYGIVWISGGELHNAVYDASASPPADLVLGPVLQFGTLEGLSARSLALAWWNDEVRVVWSGPDDDRIQMLSGTLGPTGIEFEPFSAFTNVRHDALSDVVIRDGAMYIAAAQDGRIALYRTTTGGTGWEEAAACETTWDEIRGRLLFADPAGDIWVAESFSNFDNRLRNFSDCGTRPFPLAAVSGKLYYHPGG